MGREQTAQHPSPEPQGPAQCPNTYWEGCRRPSWAAAARSCPGSRGCSAQRRRRPPPRTPRAAASGPAGRHSTSVTTRLMPRRLHKGGNNPQVLSETLQGWGRSWVPLAPAPSTQQMGVPAYHVQHVAAHLHQEGGQEVEDVQQLSEVAVPGRPHLQPPRRAPHLGLAAALPQHHHVAPGQPPRRLRGHERSASGG